MNSAARRPSTRLEAKPAGGALGCPTPASVASSAGGAGAADGSAAVHRPLCSRGCGSARASGCRPDVIIHFLEKTCAWRSRPRAAAPNARRWLDASPLPWTSFQTVACFSRSFATKACARPLCAARPPDATVFGLGKGLWEQLHAAPDQTWGPTDMPWVHRPLAFGCLHKRTSIGGNAPVGARVYTRWSHSCNCTTLHTHHRHARAAPTGPRRPSRTFKPHHLNGCHDCS